METKNINILSFFIDGICKPDMGYLDTIYVVHIQLCCKKIIGFEKRSIFRVLKIGFHGVTFVARQHNTNGKFHFSLKFFVQLMWSSEGSQQ